MRLVFHVGFPKTATSYMQHAVFKSHCDIIYLGLRAGDENLDQLVRYEVNRDSCEFNATSFRDRMLFAVDRAVRANSERSVAVISVQGLATAVRGDRGLAAERIKAVFDDVQVLVSIREQIDYLESTYWEHRQAGPWRQLAPFQQIVAPHRPISIAEWMDQRRKSEHYLPTFSRLDFWPLISKYRSVFGAENTHVFVYEHFKRDRAGCVRKVLAEIGVDPGGWDASEWNTVVNPRLDPVDEAFGLSPLRRGAAGVARRVLPKSLKVRARKIAGDLLNTSEQKLSAEERNFVANLVRAGNCNIEREIGLNLRELGYAT